MKYARRINDNKRRKLFKKMEIFQCLIHVLMLFSSDFKLILKKKLIRTVLQNSFKTGIKNYCVLTTRSRGVYRDFKLSRMSIKSLGVKGLLFGLKKLS